MKISLAPWFYSNFWDEHPDGDMEFWAMSKPPKAKVGEQIEFFYKGQKVASATIALIEEPGASACTTTGKFASKWKIHWRKDTFKDLRTQPIPFNDRIETIVKR
jgi:hypothetical protein